MTGTELSGALQLLTGMISGIFEVFSVFPLNLILVGGISGIVLKLVKRTKGTVS